MQNASYKAVSLLKRPSHFILLAILWGMELTIVYYFYCFWDIMCFNGQDFSFRLLYSQWRNYQIHYLEIVDYLEIAGGIDDHAIANFVCTVKSILVLNLEDCCNGYGAAVDATVAKAENSGLSRMI